MQGPCIAIAKNKNHNNNTKKLIFGCECEYLAIAQASSHRLHVQEKGKKEELKKAAGEERGRYQ